jgi:hypothetical protein
MLVSIGSSLTQAVEACLVAFVISVGKVESGNTHTLIDQFLQRWDIPTGRTQSTDNFGLTVAGIRLGHDLFQCDIGSSEFGHD